MKISEMLLPEYDLEVVNTRKLLERVPQDKFTWKPHEKSMTLGQLAGHVAELPTFLSVIIRTEKLELSNTDLRPFQPASTAELVEVFNKNAVDTRPTIAEVSDSDLGNEWQLTFQGASVYGGRKSLLLLNTLGHMIHHRGQLTVYLRLVGVAFPGMYGPSADEMGIFEGGHPRQADS